MKSAFKLFALSLAIFTQSVRVNAQSPREELTRLVEELRNSVDPCCGARSGNVALRRKIILLASTLMPPPGIPDAAIIFEGRAQFAFKTAKSPDDFLVAALEYEKAVAAAPWVSGYYSDLCTIYEQAGSLEDAKRMCEFYLIALTDPGEITDAKRRIAGLEFGIEKAKSPQAQLANRTTRDADLIRSLEGVVFSYSFMNIHREYRIANGRALVTDRRTARGGPLCGSGMQRDGPVGEQMECPHDAYDLVGRRGERSSMFGPESIEIAEDGQTILEKVSNGNAVYEHLYKRQ